MTTATLSVLFGLKSLFEKTVFPLAAQWWEKNKYKLPGEQSVARESTGTDLAGPGPM